MLCYFACSSVLMVCSPAIHVSGVAASITIENAPFETVAMPSRCMTSCPGPDQAPSVLAYLTMRRGIVGLGGNRYDGGSPACAGS